MRRDGLPDMSLVASDGEVIPICHPWVVERRYQDRVKPGAVFEYRSIYPNSSSYSEFARITRTKNRDPNVHGWAPYVEPCVEHGEHLEFFCVGIDNLEYVRCLATGKGPSGEPPHA